MSRFTDDVMRNVIIKLAEAAEELENKETKEEQDPKPRRSVRNFFNRFKVPEDPAYNKARSELRENMKNIRDASGRISDKIKSVKAKHPGAPGFKDVARDSLNFAQAANDYYKSLYPPSVPTHVNGVPMDPGERAADKIKNMFNGIQMPKLIETPLNADTETQASPKVPAGPSYLNDPLTMEELGGLISNGIVNPFAKGIVDNFSLAEHMNRQGKLPRINF